MIAPLVSRYADKLHDDFSFSRDNGEPGYTLGGAVVAPLKLFFDELYFPHHFSAADQQPILEALGRCDDELKHGMRGVALGWVQGYLGAVGETQPSVAAIGTVRAICEALQI